MPYEQEWDQADGLRKLLLRPSVRVVTVIGAQAGQGATSMVVNLAGAFAELGKRVLVLDENCSSENVANRMKLKPRFDLLNTVRDNLHWRDVVLQARQNIHVLPVAKAMQALPRLDQAEGDRLLENLNAASWNTDVVLVDASADGHSICGSLNGDEPLLLVLNATPSSIKETYTLLKQLAMEQGKQSFDLLINKARDEGEARRVFDNMHRVAAENLQVRLNYMGHIPFDEQLAAMNSIPHGWRKTSPVPDIFAGLARQLLQPEEISPPGCNALSQLMQRLVLNKPAILRRKAA